jgi:A/G-specific adenine glycosylase
MDIKKIKEFQKTIWDFYKKNKRSFPWRETKDPYHILVSEIMLQQTQADRVVKFYEAWIKKFPDFASLVNATFGEIYPLWQGLGYNRRALALQKLSKVVVEEYRGELPKDLSLLQELPGIGPYTARAVSIFSYNRPITCLETNIRRVFIHHFFEDADVIEDKEILPLMEEVLPETKSRQWHWALMDYGAYLKSIVKNPNRRSKSYSIQSKFEGSAREVRGAILKVLANKGLDEKSLSKITKLDLKRIQNVLPVLEKEGLIIFSKKKYQLN